MTEARFTRIEGLPGAAGIPPAAQFTLEDRSGVKCSFMHPDFARFVRRAVALVMPGNAPTDTDELLNRWFDLTTDEQF